MGGFDDGASQLMFEKDISQLAKPEIKGRGFLGSGKEIIETQTYFTLPEKDWEFDDTMLVTYNNPEYIKQCKLKGIKVDDSGFIPQKKLDEVEKSPQDEEKDIDDNNDNNDDWDNDDDNVKIPIKRSKPKPSADGPAPIMRPPMSEPKSDDKPPIMRSPMSESKSEDKPPIMMEKPKEDNSIPPIMKVEDKTENKSESTKVSQDDVFKVLNKTSVRDKLEEGTKDIEVPDDNKVIFDKTAVSEDNNNTTKVKLKLNTVPKLKLNIKPKQ